MLIAKRLAKNTPQFDRLARLYASQCESEPALMQYPTLSGLLFALSKRGAPMPVRSAILSALIALSQKTRDPLWSSILLRTFDGMLGRVLERLQGIDDRADAESLVTVSFLEALQRIRPTRDPLRIAMYVRQETRRRHFSRLKWELDGEELVRGIDVEAQPDPATLEPIENRIGAWRPTPEAVTDEELLRSLAIRGGLRILTRHLLPDASRRHREHFYRRLLNRRARLAARRRGFDASRKTL